MSDGLYEPSISGVIPTLNPPTKHGIAISGDQTWERLWFTGNNILDDPYIYNGITYRYRIYCAIDAIEWRDINGNNIPGAVPDPVMGWRKTTLVLTNDFITFIKPNLGIVSSGICNGSSANNVLNVPQIYVFKDLAETNPARRYKGLAPSTKDGIDLRIWYSADGVTNWTMNSVAALNVICDTINILTYDAASDNYIAYVRSWWYRENRCVSRITIPRSQIFQAWPTPSTWTLTWSGGSWGPLISAGSTDLILRTTESGGYYDPSFSVYHSDVQLMLPALLNVSTNFNTLYAAYSRSLTGEYRTPQNDTALSGAFISPGNPGTSDALIYSCPLTVPIGSGEELFLYSGYQGTHEENAPDFHNYIHKAVGRLHGLITLKSTSNVTTMSEALELPSNANGLVINAKALGTSSIKFALCDINGTELTGFGLAQSNSFTGNSTEFPVTWSGSPSWASVAGQVIRIKTQIIASVSYPVERASFRFTADLTVQFPVTSLTIRENCGSSPFKIPVLISSAPSSDINVTVSLTSGNSADIGGWTTETLMFPAGKKAPQFLSITTNPQNNGSNTPLVFTIGTGSGFSSGAPLVITVVDDDVAQPMPPCIDPVFLMVPVNGSASAEVNGVSPNLISNTLPSGGIASFTRTSATVNIVGPGNATITITPDIFSPFTTSDFALNVPITVLSSPIQINSGTAGVILYGTSTCSISGQGGAIGNCQVVLIGISSSNTEVIGREQLTGGGVVSLLGLSNCAIGSGSSDPLLNSVTLTLTGKSTSNTLVLYQAPPPEPEQYLNVVEVFFG